ncbi:MAG: class II aldolase/adducin family protein [Bacteroidales bacterium]|nr:class II aldolase/adducin family protein [Bacteroidales bacterium]
MKQKDLDLFTFWAHEAGKAGLIKCSSGNLSQRLSDQTMLISGTGSWLPFISTDEISRISIYEDDIDSVVKPSAEYRIHRAIMRKRPDVNTVLHFQSPSATTIACMDITPDYNVIIEVPIYIGDIGFIPFLPPGSDELARAIDEQVTTFSLVQLANHGQVVCGSNYQDVIRKAVFFEFACSILLQCNFKNRPIPDDQLKSLAEYSANQGSVLR